MYDVYVGLDSTLDKVFLFDSMKEIEKIVMPHTKKLFQEVAYYLKKKKDMELVIDDFKWKDEIRNGLEPYEKMVSLGGNAAIEASAFHSLGVDAKFVGVYSKYMIDELRRKNPRQLNHFLPTLSELSMKTTYKPTSYILQISGMPSRVILCDGAGRRFEHVKKAFKNLVRHARGYVSLVGWHVLFPNGVDSIVHDYVNKLASKSFLFSDIGPVSGKKNLKEILDVVFMSNVVAMNETEYDDVRKAVGSYDKIMERYGLDSLYIHSYDFQFSVSKERKTAEIMKKAQLFSAAAATFKIETSMYPSLGDVENVLKRLKADKIKIRKRKNFYIVRTPTFKPKRIISTVGAGDVSLSALITKYISQI